MTVSSEVQRSDYAGNGSTTAFATGFRFLENSHIKVILTVNATGVETTQIEITNYTLTGAGLDTGGTVTMLVAPATGETLTIKRDVPLTQGTDYVENDDFPAESHEDALDKLTMIVQQQQEEIDRSVKLVDTSQFTNVTIPDPESGRMLEWDSEGNLRNVDASSKGLVVTDDFIKSITLSSAKADLNAKVGFKFRISNRGEGLYKYVAGETANGFNIIQHDTLSLQLQYVVEREVNVKHLGAIDDYDPSTGVVITDSLGAFNAARDLAKRATGLNVSIYIPGTHYFLSDEWDLTSQALDPGLSDRRQGLNIYFEKRSTQFLVGTQLHGGGGALKSVVNTSGSDGISTYNMGLRRARNTVSPAIVGSRVGLLQARTVGAGQTENALDQKHHNLFIFMGSDTSFSDNFGTIGLINLAGEESNYHNIQIWANSPLIHTSTKNVIKTGDSFDNAANDSIDIGQFTSLPLHTAGSNTVFNYSGQGRLIAFDYIAPPLLINNAATLDMGATFLQYRESTALEQTGVTPIVEGLTNWGIDSWNCFGFKHFGAVEGSKMYHTQRRAFEDFEVNVVLNEDVTVPGVLRSAWVFFDDGGTYTCRRGKAIIRNNNIAGVLGGKRGDDSTTSELSISIKNVEFVYSRDYGDGTLDKRVLRKMLTSCCVEYDDFTINVPQQGIIEFEQTNVDIDRRNDPAVPVLDIEFPSFQANLGSAAISLKTTGIASNVSLAGGGAASVGFPAVNSFEFTANAVRVHNAQDIFVPASITVSNGDGAESLAGANIIVGTEVTLADDDPANKVRISLHPDTGAGANNAEVFVNLKYTLMWSGGVEEGPKIIRLA